MISPNFPRLKCSQSFEIKEVSLLSVRQPAVRYILCMTDSENGFPFMSEDVKKNKYLPPDVGGEKQQTKGKLTYYFFSANCSF